MKVLYVVPGSPIGVDHIFAKRQATALREAGFQITAFFIKTWSSTSTLISEYLKLRRVVNQTKPDIIHARYGTMTAAVCALTSVRRLLITFGGSDLDPVTGNTFRKLFGYLLSQLAALKATRLICVSEHLRNRLWWKRDRVVVIPDGVDLELFRPMATEGARSLLGWGLTERIVLFNAGKDPVLKGHNIAETAVLEAEKIIGPIRLITLSYNVEPDIMPLYYNGADCLILASLREGSPNVVKEAMACNLPVVAAKVGDVPERLRKVYPSFITEREPLKLGKALAEVLRLKVRSNGREMANEVSLDVTTKRLIQVYSDLFKDSQ